jgi:hypothetical protein
MGPRPFATEEVCILDKWTERAYGLAETMDRMQEMLPRVEAYLSARDWLDVPVMAGRSFRVTPLAQGEYNLNYLLTGDETRLVLRVNVGTQIDRDDQIVYEYKALRLLESSGVTPVPHFVDDARTDIDRGILIMSYLPGEPLDYWRDLGEAAALLAIVHQVPVPEEKNHLIREDAPLSLIYRECAGLLRTYGSSRKTPGPASSTRKSTRATSSSTANERACIWWIGRCPATAIRPRTSRTSAHPSPPCGRPATGCRKGKSEPSSGPMPAIIATGT